MRKLRFIEFEPDLALGSGWHAFHALHFMRKPVDILDQHFNNRRRAVMAAL